MADDDSDKKNVRARRFRHLLADKRHWRRATIAATLFLLFVALDVALLYPLQLAGSFEGPVTLANTLAFSASLPGYVVGMVIDLNSAGYRSLPFLASGPIFTAGMIWLAIFGVSLLTTSPSEVALPKSSGAADTSSQQDLESAHTSRRRFILATAGGTTALGAAGLYPAFIEPRWPELKRHRLTLRNLRENLNGQVLLQLSDLHLGPYVSESYLLSIVQRCNELHPDVVVLTGDYVYSSPRFTPRVAAIIGRLRPRLATIAVLGNHDHWEGAELMRRHLRQNGVQLVDNDRVFLNTNSIDDQPSPDGSLCIAGIGDHWADVIDFDAALGGVDGDIPRLLLSHNPDTAELEEALSSEHRVDLMIAGHTHGGQVRLPTRGALFTPSEHGEKYVEGFVQGPAFPVYVNVGIGVGTLPTRMGVRPELTLFELASPSSQSSAK